MKNKYLSLVFLFLTLFLLNMSEVKAQMVHTFLDTVQSGDPTLTGSRLRRDAVQSTCASPKTCPGSFSGSGQYYDTFRFRNVSASTQCVTVTYGWISGAQVFFTAYNNYFDPGNVCTNYLADGGSSVTSSPSGDTLVFSFNVAAGATLVLVGNGSNASQDCEYTLSVVGYSIVLFGYVAPICVGSNTFFEIDTTGSDSTYWQVNDGSGWSAGTRGGDTLFLNNVTSAMDSNLYRALIYKGATIDTSAVDTLTVRANPDITGITSSLNPNVNSIYVPKQCTNLTASVTGGKTPYTYSWTPSGSVNPLNACPTLGAWYKATVTDSYGCQDTMSIKQYVMDATSPYPGRVTMCIQSGRRLTTANVQLSLVPFYLSKNFAMGACGATPSKQGGYVFDEMEDLYKVYPNPFAHQLNIEFFNLFEEEVSINLTDMTGRVVKEIFKGQMFEGDYTTFTVDASDLPNGMYLVRYSSNSDMRVNKVQLMR